MPDPHTRLIVLLMYSPFCNILHILLFLFYLSFLSICIIDICFTLYLFVRV